MEKRKTALIVGAVGIVGRALLGYFEKQSDWDVIAVSRREPDFPTRAVHLKLDLNSVDSFLENRHALANVTHVFYAAYQGAPTRAGLVEPNVRMLRNLLEGVDENCPRLEHVSLVLGMKGYGADLGPYKTPAQEGDPRQFPPTFYYDQEDLITEFQQGKHWTWSGLRPTAVCGIAIGNPMNIVSAIAVYASLCRELGVPFRFPGSPAAFHALFALTDADLLAKAASWASQRTVNGDIFNVPNGDLIRWENVWDGLAKQLDVVPGRMQSISLAEFMADKAPIWEKMVRKYDLKPYSFAQVASWEFADTMFHRDWDSFASDMKLRQAGFVEYVDTHDMFARQFRQLRELRIIP